VTTLQKASAASFDVLDPADGSRIGEVEDAGPREARAAVDEASAAAASWAGTSPRTRSEILHRAHDLVVRDTESLADLVSAESGKALADASAELAYAAQFLRWFAEEATRPDGDWRTAPGGGVRNLVTHRPVGVSALVTPWNFPAAMVTRKVAPALAAGCTAVLKPAAETPLTALALAQVLLDAGLPQDVLRVVTTSRPGDVVGAWLADPRVRKLSFTGSTEVGRTLLRQSADRVINVSMELGGNAPFIVLDDANVDAAIDGLMIAKFRGGGQACTAANRIYVHEAVAFDFVARLAQRVHQLVVGPGRDHRTDVGPLISARAVTRVEELIEDAVRGGARVAAQARMPVGLHGHYVAPTVLADVTRDARVVNEEIFGPVAPVITWRDVDELVDMAQETESGLAAYVYSADLQRALQLSERLDVGMVGVNRGLVSDVSAPFGGTKQSGLGREGAREGIRAFQETQYVSVDWQPAPHPSVVV
jgi:succinate-semialdehyde dehydrogenase/glutarate-semialdehyde dehydrogenase